MMTVAYHLNICDAHIANMLLSNFFLTDSHCIRFRSHPNKSELNVHQPASSPPDFWRIMSLALAHNYNFIYNILHYNKDF